MMTPEVLTCQDISAFSNLYGGIFFAGCAEEKQSMRKA